MPQIVIPAAVVYLPEDRNAQTLFLQNPSATEAIVAMPGRNPTMTVGAVAATDGIIIPASPAAPLILHGALARCEWTFMRGGSADGNLRYFRSALSDEDII